MFAQTRTAIRVREWNRENSKYKKFTVRGQIKNAEYAQGSQGEGRVTRASAAESIPDLEFPEWQPMSDEQLRNFLEDWPEENQSNEKSENISDQQKNQSVEQAGTNKASALNDVPLRRQPARNAKK